MIGFTNANQAMWAICRLLLFIRTSLLTGKCSQLRLSRCACPCMILSSALRSHLRAGNWDEETRAAREPIQLASLTENCMYAGSWTDWERAAQKRACHVNITSLQWNTGSTAWKDATFLSLSISMCHVFRCSGKKTAYNQKRNNSDFSCPLTS